MKKIPPMPQKTPLIDKDGRVTQPWVFFFQAFIEAITELQDAVDDLQGGP